MHGIRMVIHAVMERGRRVASNILLYQVPAARMLTRDIVDKPRDEDERTVLRCLLQGILRDDRHILGVRWPRKTLLIGTELPQPPVNRPFAPPTSFFWKNFRRDPQPIRDITTISHFVGSYWYHLIAFR